MIKFKWYVNGSDDMGSNLDWLGRKVNLPEEQQHALATNLRNTFYELEFEIEADEKTGDILKVTQTK